MGSRSTARRLAMQAIFQSQASGCDIEQALSYVFDDNQDVIGDSKAFSEKLAKGVIEHRQDIDKMIELGSKNWALDRINMVDKSILQIAFYELMYEKDTPKAVVIDEAVELAKKYSEEDAPKFINGILDAAVV